MLFDKYFGTKVPKLRYSQNNFLLLVDAGDNNSFICDKSWGAKAVNQTSRMPASEFKTQSFRYELLLMYVYKKFKTY